MIRATTIVLTSMVAVATPAVAQFPKGTVEVALQAGGSVDTWHTDHSRGLVSRSLAYSATDRAQVGLRFGEAINRSGDVASFLRADADMSLPPAGPIVPYAGFHGGGLLRFEDGVAVSGSYGLQMGGKMPVTKTFGVGLEAAYSLPMTGPQTGSVSIVAEIFWLFAPRPKSSAE